MAIGALKSASGALTAVSHVKQVVFYTKKQSDKAATVKTEGKVKRGFTEYKL